MLNRDLSVTWSVAAMLFNRNESMASLDPWVPQDQSGHGRGAVGPLDVKKLTIILRWHARLIAVVAASVLLLAGLALLAIPPKYKAVTVVLVDPRQPRVTASEAVLSGIGADAAAVESQVELIQSSPIAKRVISKLDLDKDPDFIKLGLFEIIRGVAAYVIGGSTPDDEDARLNKLVYRFQTGLSVQRRGLTYILEVGYSSVDAQKAAAISRAVADAYLEDQRTRRSNITADASGWLGGRIEELRQRVEKSERAVADYKTSNNLVNVTQGNKLISRQIEDITQQIALARSRKAEAQGRLERVKDASRQPESSAGLGEVLQSQVVTTLRTQYAEVARQEADLRAIYGERHPVIVAIRAQAADLRRQIEHEIARVVEGIRNDYQVARSREAALESELAGLQMRAGSLGQADVRLNELEREAQSDRSLYETFLSRAKETGEQQSLQITEARIASPALVPIKSERPPSLVLIAAAGVLGLLIGVSLALILEQLRRGFRSAEDVAETLGLGRLGTLPQFDTNHDIKASARLAIEHPTSDYAGSLWALMTRLQRAARTSRDRNVVAILSALPQEGKSTLACNLALASAASGVKTLLIDADPHARTVTRVFDLDQPGLNEVTQGSARLGDALTRDTRSGLYLLSARDLSASAGARGLPSLMCELKDQFELIIVDCPAILPVDGGAFVEHADRIAFVIAWESTDRTAVEQAFQMLGSHASKVDGVILNNVAARWYKAFDEGRYLRYEKQPVAAAAAPTSTQAPVPPRAPAPVQAPAPTTVANPAPARVAVFTRRARP
jgi:succinoglycan biosynthesis transport protein ExoP